MFYVGGKRYFKMKTLTNVKEHYWSFMILLAKNEPHSTQIE